MKVDPTVCIVVDDVASTDPWTARGIEVRGRALAAGGRTRVTSMAQAIRRGSP